jgi:uncharacterized membrane protein YhdT
MVFKLFLAAFIAILAYLVKKTKILSNKPSLFPISCKKTGLLAKNQVYWRKKLHVG